MPKTRQPEATRYLTVAEAAEFLGVSPNTIRRLIEAHELRAVDVGVADQIFLRIADVELQSFIARRAVS